ncbi:MAG: trypsin-like peptidase domain-containing protein, partial [Cyanobacteria bacterium J06632_3]
MGATGKDPLIPEQSYQEAKQAIARIHGGSRNKVIGTGFLVPGGVITCAHVIRDALGLKGKSIAPPIGAEVKISFPFSRSKKPILAEVYTYEYLKEEDKQRQDIAALKLLEALPEGAVPLNKIASHGLNNSFRVIGFPSDRTTAGREATGTFMAQLADDFVQIVEKQGSRIQGGYSGSAIWDESENAVVGMTVAVDVEEPDEKLAFMVPAAALIEQKQLLEPFGLLALLSYVDDDEESAKVAVAISQAYMICSPEGWTIPAELADKLSSLQEIPSEENEFEAIDQFAALLTLPNLLPEGRLSAQLIENITQWLKPRIGELDALLAQVKTQLSQWQQRQKTTADSLLMIYVKDESAGSHYSVSAFFMQDVDAYDPSAWVGYQRVLAPKAEPFGEFVSAESLPKLIKACVDEVNQRSPHQLVIHLILPLALLQVAGDRANMNDEEFDFIGEDRVGSQYRFVVRIADRWNPSLFNRYREPWEKKWKALLELSATDVCAAFVAGDHLTPGSDLRAALMQDSVQGLKLFKGCEDSQRFRKICGDVILSGTPAAIWLRSSQFATGVNAIAEIDAL